MVRHDELLSEENLERTDVDNGDPLQNLTKCLAQAPQSSWLLEIFRLHTEIVDCPGHQSIGQLTFSYFICRGSR